MNEVSVTYADSGHAGDRRKRSQMGHLNHLMFVPCAFVATGICRFFREMA